MNREIFAPRRHDHRYTLARAAAVIALSLVPFQFSFSQEARDSDTEPNFSLQEGRGVPVCEAYLELLNKTKFEVTPFCGRPSEGPVKGFEHLDGHFMKEEEIWPLFTKVWEYMRFGDQNHSEKYYYPPTDNPPTAAHWSTEATSHASLALSLRHHWMNVWAYTTPIDINNDGTGLSIMCWILTALILAEVGRAADVLEAEVAPVWAVLFCEEPDLPLIHPRDQDIFARRRPWATWSPTSKGFISRVASTGSSTTLVT